MTGDDNLTQIHVEAALQQCSTFVVLNTTLQEAEPEVTYTIENICPNNCSGHGDCNGGKYPYIINLLHRVIVPYSQISLQLSRVKSLDAF